MINKDIHVVFNEYAGNTLLRSKVLNPENSEIVVFRVRLLTKANSKK